MGGNRGVTLQLNATNLLNIVNYARVDTVVNSPTFGQVLVGPADAVDAVQPPVPVLTGLTTMLHRRSGFKR